MKAITYFCSLFLFGTLLFSSCMNDTPDFGQEEEIQGEGKVSFAAIKVDVDLHVTTKAEDDTKNYIIRIYSTKTNQLVQEYSKLSEVPEIITLEVGDYRIEALSHELKAAEFGTPFYKGTQTFTIKKDEVTEVSAIKCTFQSIKVTVSFTQKLEALLGNKEVTITIGDGNLKFDNKDQVGYFAAKEASNVLLAKFQGTVDGELTSMSKSFSNVKAGEYYNVEFDIELPSIGDAALNLKLDASCTNIKVPVLVSPGADDDIQTEDRPENPGQARVPTITGRGFNIASDKIELIDGETKVVVVDIKAEQRIKNLKVVIDSEKLTDEVLDLAGITRSFDLCYPGEIEGGLKNLGFPTGAAVLDQKAMVFDVTEFTPLLGALGSGTHRFYITVTDKQGNIAKATLTLATIIND